MLFLIQTSNTAPHSLIVCFLYIYSLLAYAPIIDNLKFETLTILDQLNVINLKKIPKLHLIQIHVYESLINTKESNL